MSIVLRYWLRQIRKYQRSLDIDDAKSIVHAFVTCCADECNLALAGSSETITDWLQRVLNATTRVVSGTQNLNPGLTHLLSSSSLHVAFTSLHLDVSLQIHYELGATVRRCH